MTAVVDFPSTAPNGPGERPKKGFDIGTDHTITRAEYETRHRNETIPAPARGTITDVEPPQVPLTVDELLALTPAAEVRAAVEALHKAGFSDEGVVHILLGESKYRRNPGAATDRVVAYLAAHGGEHRSPSGKVVAELARALGLGTSHLTSTLVALARAGRITRDVSNSGTTRVSLA